METSEFAEAYEQDDPGRRSAEEQRLGEAILSASIRSLDPRPAALLPESATIREAIQLMLDRRIGAVLVVRDGKPVGIFTERDVVQRVTLSGIGLDSPIIEVSTRDPEALGLDDGIAFALNRMVVGGFRNLPIVDESGAPRSVLSQRDVVAFIVSLLPGRVLNLPPEPKLEAHSEDGG